MKLANIELMPEKLEYRGGVRHVEGQLVCPRFAQIVYTKVYKNFPIERAHLRLAFRQQSDRDATDEVNYPQNEDEWLEEVFGCSNQAAVVQVIDSIDARGGRVLTRLNILQHQVRPFKLADPTKPGRRKILALFLVDPNIRVISTANVPCQPRDWWSQAVLDERGSISNLLVELQDTIFDAVDGFSMTLDEARILRRELMKERGQFVVAHGEAFEETEFSLCEH